MNKTIKLNNPDETTNLAIKIGAELRGGECFELVSDLGGGKTTFVSGLVRGMGSKDNVSSPTFTIGKQYRAKKLRVYHYDFYRLQDAGLVAVELAEALESDDSVMLVEWAQTVRDVLPKDRVVIEINKLAKESEGREMTFKIPNRFGYIDKVLK